MGSERFEGLPREKQTRILNAGFSVFGKNEYKHASTDQIAMEAGISKGYLFYYFRNKKDFYLYLYEQALSRLKAGILDPRFSAITDFFELMEHAAHRKYEILVAHPHILDFVIRAFYSEKEEVSDELHRRIREETAQLFTKYFQNIDFSRFKNGIDPQEIMRMLTWMADGYLHELEREGHPPTIDEMMDKFRSWLSLLKTLTYKEEYLP